MFVSQLLPKLFQFLKFLYSKLKTIINGQYHNDLVKESLNMIIYIILLYFIKVHKHDSYDQMVYIIQSKYFSKSKTKKAQK